MGSLLAYIFKAFFVTQIGINLNRGLRLQLPLVIHTNSEKKKFNENIFFVV